MPMCYRYLQVFQKDLYFTNNLTKFFNYNPKCIQVVYFHETCQCMAWQFGTGLAVFWHAFRASKKCKYPVTPHYHVK